MGIVIVLALFAGIAGVVAGVWAIGMYNQLVQVKVNVDKSWSNIEVLQKQRYDEIPKLVKICEGYMQYERETLEKITAARTRFLKAKTPGRVAEADQAMAGALKTLFAVSENYPQLKADATFRQLQERVSYLESQIADRREFYNDSVAILNTRIRQIPDVFIANAMRLAAREMYRVPQGEQASPEIKFTMPH
jgi:LemA protein